MDQSPASSTSSVPPSHLSGRFFVALGIGFGATAIGAGLVAWALYYEITSLCVGTTEPCTPGALQPINGVLFLVGILLTFIGLGFAFAVLVSDSGRWKDK